jgi:hypothetical protein
MLTTHTPWAGIEAAAVPIRIAFDFSPQFSLPDNLTDELTTIIGLMLLREPEERPTVTELLTMRPFNNKDDSENGTQSSTTEEHRARTHT